MGSVGPGPPGARAGTAPTLTVTVAHVKLIVTKRTELG